MRRAVSGGPLAALAFALRCNACRGRSLRAGDLVSTGAVTGVHPIRAGQSGPGHFHRHWQPAMHRHAHDTGCRARLVRGQTCTSGQRFRTIPFRMTRTRKKTAATRAVARAASLAKNAAGQTQRHQARVASDDQRHRAARRRLQEDRVARDQPLAAGAGRDTRDASRRHARVRLRARPAGARAGVPALVPDRPGVRQPQRAVHRATSRKACSRRCAIPSYELVVHPCDRSSADYSTTCARSSSSSGCAALILCRRSPRTTRWPRVLDRRSAARYVRIASPRSTTPARMVDLQRPPRRSPKWRTTCVARAPPHRADRRPARLPLGASSGATGSARRWRGAGDRAAADELIVEGGYTFESGVAGGERLLALNPRPTAIFASNDEMAAGVYTRGAASAGFDFPATFRSSASTTARSPRASGRR